ncbi:MAG: DegV family protein [Chloroflexi bacterium]|nr:MAG: DegV family protein [Chloroflexota bacterium]
MSVAVVVDSTADIPQAMRDEYAISVVPLSIIFGNETFQDGVDMTSDQFYQRLTESNVHPSSSQPSPGAFAEVYERLAQNHAGIISIHISGKLSGTVRSAAQAQELVPNIPIRVIDSGSVSMGFGFLGLEAAKLARAGHTLDDIATQIERMVPNIRLWAVLDTLKYLERGGRIGRTRAFLGTLLNVKPMIQIKEEVLPAEQVRTHKKAIARMVDLASAEGPYEHLAVLHSAAEPLATELANQLGSLHPRDQIVTAQLTGVIGVHGGPGVLGVTGIKKA